MRFIKEFNEYMPDESKLDRLENIISDRYDIKEWRGDKYISISDKTHFLTGPLLNKGRLVDKIFFDINDGSEHEPSLRKAIRNWINKNS
jgi:hypothetical protein